MIVSGLTMTSVVRHSFQAQDSHTHSRPMVELLRFLEARAVAFS